MSDQQQAPTGKSRSDRTSNTPASLTVADVARRYRVGEHTILRWINSGQLLAVNVGRSPGARKPRWRISEQALADFEAARRTTAPPPPRTRRRQRPADVIEFY
jgi:excisionase family DNA binding protein